MIEHLIQKTFLTRKTIQIQGFILVTLKGSQYTPAS